MSDTAQPVPPPSDSADSPTPWKPLPVEKLPPRPAPTDAYSWRDYNPNARRIYIRDHLQANAELSRLSQTDNILGFDLEWRPNFVKGGRENPTALVQLANHDTILLVQISAMQEFPTQLRLLLENPTIIKCGVAIQADAVKIFRDCRTSLRGCVDLSLLARTVDNARWRGKYNSSLGLAHLVESYEYRILLKGKITRTNWEKILNLEQQEYASNDAHAAYILYRKLEGMIPEMPTPPAPVWYSFNMVGGSLLTPEGKAWHAHNPNYDPGPSPPPRPPREDKKDSKGKRKADGVASTEKPEETEPNKLPRLQQVANQTHQAVPPKTLFEKALHTPSNQEHQPASGFKVADAAIYPPVRSRSSQPAQSTSTGASSSNSSAQRPSNTANSSEVPQVKKTSRPADQTTSNRRHRHASGAPPSGTMGGHDVTSNSRTTPAGNRLPNNAQGTSHRKKGQKQQNQGPSAQNTPRKTTNATA